MQQTGRLPDPRRWAPAANAHSWYGLSDEELSKSLRVALLESMDETVTAALRAAPGHGEYKRLWRAVCAIAHRTESAVSTLAIRVFALPLVLITGSRRAGRVSGVVPDVGEIQSLLEKHGALGTTRNFGVGNALCTLETLERVRASDIYRWTESSGEELRALAPEAIAITAPGEHVHLRFLAGASVSGAGDPSFIEAASNIGAWGMSLTRALGAQLATSGIEVLALPRPPKDLLAACHAGRGAQLEAALDLFVSNAVRKRRAATGDPEVVISAHDDAEMRVSLSSPFDDETVDGFRWPLHPLDDIETIVGAVDDLLAECRITFVRKAPRVLRALDPRGLAFFPRPVDIDRIENVAGANS